MGQLNRQVKQGMETVKKDVIDSLLKSNKLEQKISSLHKMLTQVFSFLGDVETRMEAFKTLCIRKDIFTQDEVEDVWNEIKGLRQKSDEELIVKGDFVKISYKEIDKVSLKILKEEKNKVIIAGTGLIWFGSAVINQNVREHEFSLDDSDGKTSTIITIHSAKCKIVGTKGE